MRNLHQMHLLSVAEYMQPEHKPNERSQPEITGTVLKIQHYVDTIFCSSDLGTVH